LSFRTRKDGRVFRADHFYSDLIKASDEVKRVTAKQGGHSRDEEVPPEDVAKVNEAIKVAWDAVPGSSPYRRPVPQVERPLTYNELYVFESDIDSMTSFYREKETGESSVKQEYQVLPHPFDAADQADVEHDAGKTVMMIDSLVSGIEPDTKVFDYDPSRDPNNKKFMGNTKGV
jgi:methylmalonyl-CoA mutase N-terminal domain/subunit